ncbi:MAG: BatD family protein, partial [Bacteroidia bacterium]
MYFPRRFSVVLFFALCLFALEGQAQKIYARVSDDTVRLGESFTLTVIVEELDGTYITPSLPGFKLTGQTQNRNVDYSRGIIRNVFTYSLQAYRVGSFRIEPASVRSGKKVFRANELSVYVRADARRKDVFMRVV